MATIRHELKASDTLPEIADTDVEVSDDPTVGSGGVKLIVESDDGDLIVNDTATIDNYDASAGTADFSYQLSPSQSGHIGIHRYEWVVTYDDGDEQTVPSGDKFWHLEIGSRIDVSGVISEASKRSGPIDVLEFNEQSTTPDAPATDDWGLYVDSDGNVLTVDENGNVDTGSTGYTDEEAQDAVGTILSSQFNYDDAGDAIDINPHSSDASAHHSRYADSEAIAAINNDVDHGSTAQHDYYTDSDAISAINNDVDHGSTAQHDYYTDSDAISAINNDADHGSTAQHDYYTNEEAQDAVGTILSSQFNYDDAGDAIDINPHSTDASAHHSRYADSEAISAINNDSDHGSTAQHDYYTDEEAQDAVGTILGSLFTYDDATPSITLDEGEIDHDALANFVSNEHVDHSGVSITAGDGITGGGDLTASRTLDVRLDIDDGGSNVTGAYGIDFGSDLGVTNNNDNTVTVDFTGSGGLTTTVITDADSPYTTQDEDVIYVDESAGAVTVTLASADTTQGNEIEIINLTGTNTVTVDTEGAETIDPNGDSSKSVTQAGVSQSYTAKDGSTWQSGLPAKGVIQLGDGTIVDNNSTGTIAIGTDIGTLDNNDTTVVIGDNASAATQSGRAENVVIGESASAGSFGRNVVVGRGANGRNTCVAVGHGASANGSNNVVVGNNTSVAAFNGRATVVGANASSSVARVISIGEGVSVDTSNVARIGGNQLVFSGVQDTIADADLNASEITMDIDETNTNIVFRLKEADGTLRTATLAYS